MFEGDYSITSQYEFIRSSIMNSCSYVVLKPLYFTSLSTYNITCLLYCDSYIVSNDHDNDTIVLCNNYELSKMLGVGISQLIPSLFLAFCKNFK